MVDYGLKGRVALITGVNNPQGIRITFSAPNAVENLHAIFGKTEK